MRRGIIRWYDVIKCHGNLLDVATMQEFFVPEETFSRLGVEYLPKNQEVMFETQEKNGVVYVSRCKLIGDKRA